MAFKPTTPAESRNIYTTGVVQQACAAGTIKTVDDLKEWTVNATQTFDIYMGNPDNRAKATASFVEVMKALVAINDLRYLYGDPTQEIGRFHDNNIALIREFANHADLYDLYTNLFRTKEGILSV
tara:strand:+ start:170 stop:544 length:375 start_codon:yes stop_codon:yes gene_type:complete